MAVVGDAQELLRLEQRVFLARKTFQSYVEHSSRDLHRGKARDGSELRRLDGDILKAERDLNAYRDRQASMGGTTRQDARNPFALLPS